ncbi:hypothetical protein GOODEAATRI_017651, partial [Goodea atripinnis]
PSEQMHISAVDAIRHALEKLFNLTFISPDKVSPSLSPAREKEKDIFLPPNLSSFSKSQLDNLCPNVLPAECLLETAEIMYVVLPYTQYSLHDIVSFSPAKLANSHAKVLFIIYQVLVAMRGCHTAGLSCGELSLQDIAVDEQLCSHLKLNLSHYEDLGSEEEAEGDDIVSQEPKNALPTENKCVSQENNGLCEDCFDELKTLVLDWVHGRVSNFHYLMELNRLAGRRKGDPNYHPVLPWVVDFTVPFGKFRDLRRSKFRLNKGDKQLEFTYEMTKEALAAASGNGIGVGGDLSVGVGGAGQSEHLHVPHHISDVLSDITYYVYKARQTPKSVLCSHVRSQWEPNEYPATMERMQSWTPDECIPEFYTDPSIFRSIHPDMPDLDVPSWCKSCEEFIEVHRDLLESRDVSQHLHHWIDLTFGYKLSGKEAIKAKNVCLHLVDNHTNLTTYGVVQLFDQPHPPRLSASQYAPAEPPILGLAALNVPSLHIPSIDAIVDTVDGMIPESKGCESTAWTMTDKDDELEQGTEAIDSLASTGSSTSVSCPVNLPTISAGGGKFGGERTTLTSQSSSPLPSDFSSGIGPALRSAVLQKGGQMNKKHGENVTTTSTEEFKIILPEGFSPLQPLEELEKLNNFLVKSLHAEVLHPATSCGSREGLQIESGPSLTNLYQRDVQALGVLTAEIFYAAKLRGLKADTPLRQRFQAIMKLCSANLRDVPLSLHHALETLLLLEKHARVAHREEPDCPKPLVFKYDPIYDGLPPPSPHQLLNSIISPFPFPSYFAALHDFVFSYHAKMGTVCSLQGRDIVFHLWQQLEALLLSNITAEGLEILLPFILALMLEKSTAVYAAWYLFEPISTVLGPRNANKYLLKPLINVYENPHCLKGRFYLYTDCFILQLIMRLGLHAFLSSLLPHVMQVLTGFESSGSSGEGYKGLRAGICNLGEEEEEDFQIGKARSSASVGGNIGTTSGVSGAVGLVGDSGLVDYSSGISLNDQVFLSEAEDFQNEFYVNNGEGVGAGKQQSQNSAAKDHDQESLSVGKLSDKSSTSELSLGDDSMRDRASLKSADSSQDLKHASEEEESGELEEEELASDSKEGMDHLASLNLDLTDSGSTLRTLQGETVNGMRLDETEKEIVGGQEEEDRDLSEESEEKEQKILLGEPVMAICVSPPSSQRLNTRKEAGLLGAVSLTQKIVVFLSDTTLMDMLMKINQDVLLPLLDLITTPRMGFPSGVQTRIAVCLKTLSLMALICLRIGREMVQQHMADTLCDFAIRKLVPNHELVWQLAESYHQSVSQVTTETRHSSSSRLEPASSSGLGRQVVCNPFPNSTHSSTTQGDSLPESGTFGSHLVGNRIQVSRDNEFDGSTNHSLASSWGRTSHATPIITTASTFSTPSAGVSSFTSWIAGPSPEDSALKQELPRSSRSLQGNWLAYWQYEIGINQQDSHFHFHQIRLQSFLGHSGTIKCLAPLVGEDYFLSGSKDKTVKLWPLYNHGDGTKEVEPRLTYSEHRKSVFYVGQLESSQEVVSCDGTVHVWDQYTDSVLRFIDPRKPGLQAAEGNLVISSSTDYTLTVWKDLENKPLRQYKSQSDHIHAFDLYGSQIVTGTVANKIGVYSMADISLSPVSSTKLSTENFRGTLTSLAVLPTKRLLLLGSDNGAIRLLA